MVYFYPADFTGGCTKQACGFRDDNKKLTDKGVEVVGVSIGEGQILSASGAGGGVANGVGEFQKHSLIGLGEIVRLWRKHFDEADGF